MESGRDCLGSGANHALCGLSGGLSSLSSVFLYNDVSPIFRSFSRPILVWVQTNPSDINSLSLIRWRCIEDSLYRSNMIRDIGLDYFYESSLVCLAEAVSM